MELTIDGKAAFAYTGGRPFDPELPAVLFLHGASADHSVWTLQARYLAHHGFGVLAVDLPGHGRSLGEPRERVADLADWTLAVLDAAGAAAAALVGHSMGSLIALDAAARYPRRVAHLALLGTAFPMRVSDELLEATETDAAAAHGMINVWSHAAYAHYPNNPGPGAWVMGANLRLMQRQKAGVLRADFAACHNYADGLSRAAEVSCPTLLVLGSRDVMTPVRGAQEIAKAIPRRTVVTVPGSGHNLMAESSDEVLDALVGFLRAGTGGA